MIFVVSEFFTHIGVVTVVVFVGFTVTVIGITMGRIIRQFFKR
jgi:hypothetical protein